jgi:hypothetical protein
MANAASRYFYVFNITLVCCWIGAATVTHHHKIESRLVTHSPQWKYYCDFSNRYIKDNDIIFYSHAFRLEFELRHESRSYRIKCILQVDRFVLEMNLPKHGQQTDDWNPTE